MPTDPKLMRRRTSAMLWCFRCGYLGGASVTLKGGAWIPAAIWRFLERIRTAFDDRFRDDMIWCLESFERTADANRP